MNAFFRVTAVFLTVVACVAAVVLVVAFTYVAVRWGVVNLNK